MSLAQVHPLTNHQQRIKTLVMDETEYLEKIELGKTIYKHVKEENVKEERRKQRLQ